MKAFLALVLLLGHTGSMLTTASGQTPDLPTGHYYTAPVPSDTSIISRLPVLLRAYGPTFLLRLLYGLPMGLIVGCVAFYRHNKHRYLIMVTSLLCGSSVLLLAIMLYFALRGGSRATAAPTRLRANAPRPTASATYAYQNLYDSGPIKLVEYQHPSPASEASVTPYQIDRSNPA